MNDQNMAITADDLKKIAEVKGQKLGLLLSNSSLSAEIKNELAALILEMNLEQMEELTDILEAQYLDAATRQIDEDFKKKLAEIIEKYQKEDDLSAAELKNQADSLI